jgi:hypothetical protein
MFSPLGPLLISSRAQLTLRAVLARGQMLEVELIADRCEGAPSSSTSTEGGGGGGGGSMCKR